MWIREYGSRDVVVMIPLSVALCLDLLDSLILLSRLRIGVISLHVDSAEGTGKRKGAWGFLEGAAPSWLIAFAPRRIWVIRRFVETRILRGEGERSGIGMQRRGSLKRLEGG